MRNRLSLLVAFLVFIIFISPLYSQQKTNDFIYVYPIPYSVNVRPQTNLIFRISKNYSCPTIGDITINVNGSQSGIHEGELLFSHNSIIFKPYHEFETSETVHVEMTIKNVNDSSPLKYIFKTSIVRIIDPALCQSYDSRNNFSQNKTQQQFPSITVSSEPKVINGVSVPSDLPKFLPNIVRDPAPGKIFIANSNGNNFYLMIFENDGTPFYYKRLKYDSFDFKLHPNNMITYHSPDDAGFIVMNSAFEPIHIFKAGNGCVADMHDVYLTQDSTALIIATSYCYYDMSTVIPGGNPDAFLMIKIIQEVDWNDNVIFEWSTFDHFNITDAVHENLTGNRIDFVHTNSISLDYDGNILISNRHQSECTKIDRTTGEIIWRLGGPNNQFEFFNENIEFSYQHAFFPVDNEPNNYTLYDNGNNRGGFSRVVEYHLDTQTMSAEKVWEYRPEPDFFAPHGGSAQRLPNGNTLVNLEQPNLPKVVEITPTGQIVYEANFFPGLEAYKSFKFDLDAVAAKPYLISEPMQGAIRLLFNKFGDDDVAGYNIYADPSEEPTTLLLSTDKTWSDIDLRPYSNYSEYYFRVTAVNSAGVESEFSNTEKITLTSINVGNSSGILGRSSALDECDPIREINPGRPNLALKFDGIDDYVDCGNDASIQIAGKNLTLEAWINVSSFAPDSHGGVIISKEMKKDNHNAGYRLSCGDNGVITFTIGHEQWYELSTPGNTIQTDTWHHVAATFDGEYQKIYVDGNLVTESPLLNIKIDNASTKNLYFGSSTIDESKHFAGLIDDVRIWAVTRSQDDIAYYMDTELDESVYANGENGLVGYWPFDEDEGQIVEDLARDNNKILNGSFSIGESFWKLVDNETAETEFLNDGDYCNIVINDGGSGTSDVEFKQENILLLENKEYKLEFDAWADDLKIINVKVRKSYSLMNDNSRIGAIALTRVSKHFEYHFTMENPSEAQNELVFQLGGNNIDFYLDNVKLIEDNTMDVNDDYNTITTGFELLENYPNPFNPETTIQYSISELCDVEIRVFDILGQLVDTIFKGKQIGGIHKIKFSAGHLPSGIYFYNVTAKSILTKFKFSKTGKMLLIK